MASTPSLLIRPEIKNQEEEVRKWRRHLHQFPELAYQEKQTQRFVVEKLKSFRVDAIDQSLGGTGVVATLHGKGFSSKNPGRQIALRADMDALPLEEKNTFAHRSQHQGIMHACGHDGHTAMLLGAAQYLAQSRLFGGTVHFIFQPAEEGLAGAKKMIDEGLFEKYPVEAVYGLHNWPLLPVGQVGIRSGAIMAAADQFEIFVRGKGGHAAYPHLTIDPIVVACHLVNAFQAIIGRQRDPLQSAVLSVTQIRGGTTFNIIPAEVYMQGSCRSLSLEMREFLHESIQKISQGVAATYGAEIEVKYDWGYPPTINTAAESALMSRVAQKILGSSNVQENLLPSMGAEDFSYMLQKRPGCYFWLGTGHPEKGTCNIHHPQYDFNDDVLNIGMQLWVELVESFF